MRGPLLVLVLVACTPVEGERGGDTTAPTLMSIEVTPAALTMKRILSPGQQLEAKAIFSDGSTQVVTSDVTWSSSDTSAVTVSDDGMISSATATAPASVMVTATFDETSGSAEVTVVDPTLVVSQYTPPRLDFFSAFDDGDVAPIRSIAGGAIAMQSGWGVAVFGDELYVLDADGIGINVYPLDASGDIAPIRRIAGAATNLMRAYGIAVTEDEIFVSGSAAHIAVFSRTADGNVVPARMIVGPETQLGNSLFGLEIHGDELYVASTGGAGAINVYPLNASGNVAPTRRLTGAATQLGSSPYAVRVAGAEMFVLNPSHVHVFPANAEGDVAPLRTIDTPDNSYGLFVLGNELLIPAYSDKSVTVHPLSAEGAPPPVRRLAGVMTKVDGPLGAFVY